MPEQHGEPRRYTMYRTAAHPVFAAPPRHGSALYQRSAQLGFLRGLQGVGWQKLGKDRPGVVRGADRFGAASEHEDGRLSNRTRQVASQKYPGEPKVADAVE